MGRKNIIGRDRETSILEAVLKSPDPEFVAVYGRRRVGKTHLVREFFESSICFEIVGIHKASLREQLDNFAHSLKKALALQIEPKPPTSWAEAFRQLETSLESSPKGGHTGKQVVFLERVGQTKALLELPARLFRN
jgi:AAA+ ATPase superfamily predicted ATPase